MDSDRYPLLLGGQSRDRRHLRDSTPGWLTLAAIVLIVVALVVGDPR